MQGKKSIEFLDTTLRDGAQGVGINFSIEDKLAVAAALDELGINWIEAGNPGSNPKDEEFFRQAKKLKLGFSKLAAFGPTRKKQTAPGDDLQIQKLLSAETDGIVIFGKSWDLHVSEILNVSPEENIAMISETISYLKEKGRFVFFDAEHFFDGWAENKEYALLTVKTALEAGADRIVLCDTNGGAFPHAVNAAVTEVIAAINPASDERFLPGIHAHNDADMASANTITAVLAGCDHVQGTLAGFGERCGNACLSALIPSLEFKLGYNTLPPGKINRIFAVTRKIAEIANITLNENMPYVGLNAFSHKAGMHTDGILKTSRSFEHIDPELVGNERNFLLSEVGGRSAIAEKIKGIDPSITRDHPSIKSLSSRLKNLESQGWSFEGADASFEILARQELGLYKPFFEIAAYRVLSEHPSAEKIACSHAWVKVLVDGNQEIAAAEGDGPVNALDCALRRALSIFFPELEEVRLSDYKVRVINSIAATAAKVRGLITSGDGKKSWSTVGVSEDIIEASFLALIDSIEYKLSR